MKQNFFRMKNTLLHHFSWIVIWWWSEGCFFLKRVPKGLKKKNCPWRPSADLFAESLSSTVCQFLIGQMEDSRPRQANYMSPDGPNQPTTLPNPTPQLYTQTQKSQISPTRFFFFRAFPSRAVAFKGNGGSQPQPQSSQTRCENHRGSPPICQKKQILPTQETACPGVPG